MVGRIWRVREPLRVNVSRHGGVVNLSVVRLARIHVRDEAWGRLVQQDAYRPTDLGTWHAEMKENQRRLSCGIVRSRSQSIRADLPKTKVGK
jgi:hypothetical protein